jgi:hypothetical protein
MMDLTKYAVVTDVWEGSAPINEDTFKANGVEAVIIRMNTSWGSLEYDINFLTEWGECSRMKRAAYVVVSPLNVGHRFTPQEYVKWILAKKPTDCNVIALDVEIDARALYDDPTITPKYYSDFLAAIFDGLHAAGVVCIQYSGAWFYAMVSPWIKPDYVFQWWARYLDSVYPPVTKNAQGNPIYPTSTWPELMSKISALGWTPLSAGLTEAMTGRIAIWQVTSVFVLPGCPYNQPVDVNVILRSDFERIFGMVSNPDPEPIPASPPGMVTVISKSGLNLRSVPSTDNEPVGSVYFGSQVPVDEIRTVGSDTWGRVSGWIAMVNNGQVLAK